VQDPPRRPSLSNCLATALHHRLQAAKHVRPYGPEQSGQKGPDGRSPTKRGCLGLDFVARPRGSEVAQSSELSSATQQGCQAALPQGVEARIVRRRSELENGSDLALPAFRGAF